MRIHIYCKSIVFRFSQTNPLEMQRRKFPSDIEIYDDTTIERIYAIPDALPPPPPPPPLPPPPPPPFPSATVQPTVVNFHLNGACEMSVQGSKYQYLSVARNTINVHQPSTGPVTYPKGYNKLHHGAGPAFEYDEDVSPGYSSVHNIVNSVSKDTSSSYQDLVMPLNPDCGYAVLEDAGDVVERSVGHQLATDPNGGVKEEGSYQELLLAMKKTDGEYASLNVQP